VCLSSRQGAKQNAVPGRIRPSGLVFDPCALNERWFNVLLLYWGLTLSWCEFARGPLPAAGERARPAGKQMHHGLSSCTAPCEEDAHPETHVLHSHVVVNASILNVGLRLRREPTHVLSLWMEVLMRWISSVSRRSRARWATVSVCRAFSCLGTRSSRDW